jgi:hypothetical protein
VLRFESHQVRFTPRSCVAIGRIVSVALTVTVASNVRSSSPSNAGRLIRPSREDRVALLFLVPWSVLMDDSPESQSEMSLRDITDAFATPKTTGVENPGIS